jgi:O-antigen/teichoic acid export membrane protein
MTTSTPPLAISGAPARESPGGSLLRRLATYALSRAASEAMLALRGVLLAVLLGPAAFGTWALLRLVMRYSALSALSVYRGLELELFQENPAHDRDGATGSALGFVLVVGGLIAGLALAGSLFTGDETLQLVLRSFAVAGLAEAVYGYVLVCIRVRGDLQRFSMLETGISILHLLCALGLAWSWGLSGAFVGLILANLLGIAIGSRWVELRPRFDPEAVRRMLRVGFPIVLTMAVGILLATGDRWVVALWGGPTMLGYYAFAGSLATAAGALAIVVRTVVFPKVYGEASSQGPAAALRSHLEGVLLPFARVLPPILGAVSLALGPLVAALAPTYTAAIAPARLFLLAGVAMGLVNIASVGAVAAGRQQQLPWYAAIALALTCGLSIVALTAGHGINGVAGATFAGHLLFAALVLRLNVRETGLSQPNRLLLGVLLPLVWCTAAVWIGGRLFSAPDLRSALGALGVYALLLLPLLSVWREEWLRLRGASARI